MAETYLKQNKWKNIDLGNASDGVNPAAVTHNPANHNPGHL